jgi:outer membrane scaffolding protein for murein synthesis (MipA/OmpV family)
MDEYFSINAADSARSGLVRDTRLLDDTADSPVTDDNGDENQVFNGLLINYSF